MEPISLSSAAASFVALGLQIYGGLVSYLGAVKARPDDLASANRQLTRLRALLNLIPTTVGAVRAQHPASITAVGECARSCENEMKALQGLLTKLDDSPSSSGHSVIESIREGKKKLPYPFSRDRIAKLEGLLEKVNGTTKTSCQAGRSSTVM
jgi:hypothetical protein